MHLFRIAITTALMVIAVIALLHSRWDIATYFVAVAIFVKPPEAL